MQRTTIEMYNIENSVEGGMWFCLDMILHPVRVLICC
jgi:hypothetical protein